MGLSLKKGRVGGKKKLKNKESLPLLDFLFFF